jgi:hypothetical protein
MGDTVCRNQEDEQLESGLYLENAWPQLGRILSWQTHQCMYTGKTKKWKYLGEKIIYDIYVGELQFLENKLAEHESFMEFYFLKN